MRKEAAAYGVQVIIASWESQPRMGGGNDRGSGTTAPAAVFLITRAPCCPGDDFVTSIRLHPGANPVSSFSRDSYAVLISINSTIGAS